jgi:hypothetical protein
MTRRANQKGVHIKELAGAVDEALDLLRDFPGSAPGLQEPDAPTTLLEQCVAMVAELRELPSEPIRTVHHFACTGGTLITKCLAAMPNTQVISEVDPLSDLDHGFSGPRFAPTDMIQLVRQSTRGFERSLVVDMFLGNLQLIQDAAVERGQRLVLRDHSHSHFCSGSSIPDRPVFRDIVASRYPVRSILTVRDPVDSFLSLLANREAAGSGWIHFDPPTFEEYCRRYQAFLGAHPDVPIFRYEDFTRSPRTLMKEICEVLHLPFNEDFEDLFGLFAITGDSGRKSDVISERTRRPADRPGAAGLLEAPGCTALRERLGYR